MTKISHVPREVLEGRLLAALDDQSKVAVVMSEDDLRLVISALGYAPDGWGKKVKQMRDDLCKLRDSAFKDAESVGMLPMYSEKLGDEFSEQKGGE